MSRALAPTTVRVIGVIAALAALVTVALAVVSMASEATPALHAWEAGLVVAANLLLVPPALFLIAWLSSLHRALAVAAGACGVPSLLLWAAAPLFNLWRFEWVWIGLSAVWWLGTAPLLMKVRRRLGILTAIVGVAAALDAVATAIPEIPFPASALVGAWKLPLSLIWIVWLAVDLLKPRPISA